MAGSPDQIAKFTPGPWAYDSSGGAIYYDDGDVQPQIASTNLESVSIEQGDADGHLIAAAPELFDALRPFAEAVAHLHPSHPDESETLDGFTCGDFRRAASAIAKALGNPTP